MLAVPFDMDVAGVSEAMKKPVNSEEAVVPSPYGEVVPLGEVLGGVSSRADFS